MIRTQTRSTVVTTAVTAPPLTVPVLAPTCPSCDSHNVSDATGLGNCRDCGLSDNLSAFMGGGMTANAKFQPSKFAKGSTSARSFDSTAVRGWTISGQID